MKRKHVSGMDVPTQKEIAGRIVYYETQAAKTKSVDRKLRARSAIAKLQLLRAVHYPVAKAKVR